MNNKFEKIIEEVKLEKLTDREKSDMKVALLLHMEKTEMEKADRNAWWVYFNMRRMTVAGAFVVTVFFGSVSLSAANSLPGDSLHNVKLAMENMRESLAFSQEAKLAIKTARVVERLNEANQLALENKLDPVTEQKVEALFTKVSEDTLSYMETIDEKENDSNNKTDSSNETIEIFSAAPAIERVAEISAEIPTSSPEVQPRTEKERKMEEIRTSFKGKLENYRDSFENDDEERPKKLIEKVDSVINSLDSKRDNRENRNRGSDDDRDQRDNRQRGESSDNETRKD